ncbi:hypothetical protein [Polaribacter butkevichii]|uniref:DUF4932 domain-containing protein n=1 Tax=Polaribacter butkevichii TaxID=218490 RepID=A0A2P6CCA8_9FLAO|nr:hypothetical protein [Polaribacter butkevichii]PQJ72523.1 hypothetical protein BTO14_04320 [Polaribacter butkevichii]
MNKIPYILTILGLCLIGCKHEKPEIETNESSISISIDDRVELFRVAYFLALEDSIDINLRPCKTDFYKTNFEPYKKYRNHPLVKKIGNGDVWKSDLPTLALCLDKNLKTKDNLNIKVLTIEFGWYGQHLDSLSKLLIDFKKTIKFKNNYNIDFKPFKDSIKSNQITKKLNRFYRTDKETNLEIFFDPLNRITNKAITFTNNPENERLVLLTYLCDQPNDSIKPLRLKWNEDYRRIVIHENSHIYTDHLYKKYYDQKLDSLVNQEKFKDEYHDIDEIIVRGLTAKILELNYGKKVGDDEIDHQPKNSRIIYEYLDKYLNDEKMEFEQAYKEIIEQLKKKYQ